MSAGSAGEAPTASSCRLVGMRGEQRALFVEEPRENGGLVASGARPIKRCGTTSVCARRPASAGVRLQHVLRERARAASTNCGSFSSTSDCSGVAVTSRFAVQTSRDIASNVAIAGGGSVRFQNV